MTHGKMIIHHEEYEDAFEYDDPGSDERHHSSLDPESSHPKDWGKHGKLLQRHSNKKNILAALLLRRP